MNQEILDLVANIESLDDALQIWAAMKTSERNLNWLQGDYVAWVVDTFGKSKATYGKLAETGFGKIKHLQQIEKISRTFGSDERTAEIPWSWFRAASDAATRVEGETPFEILMKALDHDWSYSQLAGYGKPNPVEFILVEACPVCAAQVVIRTTEFVPGTVKCPVCALRGEDTELNDLVRKE